MVYREKKHIVAIQIKMHDVSIVFKPGVGILL